MLRAAGLTVGRRVRRLAAAVAAVCAAGGLAAGCDRSLPGDQRAGRAGEKLIVVASIPPLAFVAERVGGARVEVEVLVRAGQSPHVYEPTAQQVVRVQDASLLLTVGMPFEQRVVERLEAGRRRPRVVDTAHGIERLWMEGHDHGEDGHETHDHEGHDHAGHEHDEAGEDRDGGAVLKSAGEPDPHIWLDPRLVRRQAQAVCSALVAVDAEGKAEYEANLTKLSAELEALDSELRELFGPLAGREFFVFHPAYGYLAAAYGLKQTAVEVSGKEPTPRELAALTEHARRAKVRVIFIEPQYSRTAVESLAREVGARVETLDPLARDYLANMRTMARQIAAALWDEEK